MSGDQFYIISDLDIAPLLLKNVQSPAICVPELKWVITFLEPWTFLCFWAIFGPFWLFFWPKWAQTRLFVFIYIQIYVLDDIHPKKENFFIKNDNFPIWGALTTQGPPGPPGATQVEFFPCPNFAPQAKYDFKKKLGG